MKQKINRVLSLLLCCVMVLGMLPMTAFAAEITTGNATVTAPVAGETPSFTATSDDPSKYSVKVLRWIDKAHSQDITPVVLNDSNSPYYNYKFISGMEYGVVVEFTAVGDNTLSYDNTFTINGKATSWTGNSLKRSALFTAGSSATIPTIANQEVPVGTTVYIPWPEGATKFQLYEGSTMVSEGEKSGYPTGMHITAQSTATTKTYAFKVNFSDGWLDSNEFTVTWTNAAHTVTVTGGTASPSSATVGTEITLTPSAAPSGLVFDKWKVVSGGVTVTDNKFTMPDTNVEIKATYKVSIENKEVPVGTNVFIPWPEGATKFQLYEGSTMVSEGEKSGYPTGMHITAQSTATTKTYAFKVNFSDGWLDSNEFTVTWTNAAHTVTVTGGTASPSSATVGTEITLTPSAAPSGLVFDKWKVVSGGVTVTDNKFTMPDTNVEIKATYKVSIENKEVPVGTNVFIPWPEGATMYQLFEGSTQVVIGDKSGYPGGMYIPAQSTAATKTYKFSVQFSDGWIDSNEFTVTWKNATTYSATVADINISLPAGYGSSAINELGEQRAIKITNTGTETLNINVPTLSGTNADAFNIQSYGNCFVTAGSTNSSAYAVQPKTGLEPGTYTATISCTDADGKLAVPVTATVTLTVGEHHFDTSTWEYNATHHWNPCTDTGCTAHGNEALHNSDTVKNAKAATFDTDGYTGDKHCSFCDRQMETGTAIAAGKYIRESKATMTPASITADQCANDLVFASLETSKYTVALHSVYDMTDESLNTASGKYPTDTRFVAGHQYRIIFSFSEVSPYVYDETRSTHCSTFTLNGAATNLAPFTSLAGSPNRMIELTAGASGITTYTVSFNANGGTGMMTDVTGVSGSYTLPGNDFTAPANKQFKGWATSATGTVISGNTINVTANTILYAIWEDIPVTEYIITVTDGKATIGAGSEISKAAEGTAVTLTANAAPSGKVFDKWEVVSGGITLADANSATTTFTMPASAVSVKATYKTTPVTTYNLTTQVNGGHGTISASKTGLTAGSTETITFTPDAGYKIDTVTVNGTATSVSGNTLNVTMNENKTVVVTYKAIEYNITVTDGKATIGAGSEISKAAEGTAVTLTANAAPSGKVFDKWEVVSGGITLADANSATTTFTMPASAVSVKATYKTTPVTTYNLTTQVNGGHGTISASKTGLTAGSTETITFTPDAGYKIDTVTVNGTATSVSGNTLNVTMNENKTVVVTYKAIEYTITFEGNGGTPSVLNMMTVGKKLSSLPTATRSSRYSFDGWYTAASSGTQITTAYTFSADTTVYAHWTYTGGGGGGGGGSYTPSYTVSVDKTENGTITVSPKSASKGDTVTITVKPDNGYELDTLKVLDKNGDKVKLTEKNGKYTFTMPTGKVTVKGSFVEEAPVQIFKDVPVDAYYYEAVKWAAEKGITGGIGNGLFGPNQPCTRAQIVTFLWRAAGSPAPKNMSSFADVPADAFYAKAVAWAVENGITGGTGDSKFSPDATCTRAQAVTFLYRASGSPAVSGKAEFSDVSSTAFYAEAVAWAAKKGITTGIGGGLFGSDNDCTRGQIVTFLWRAMAE